MILLGSGCAIGTRIVARTTSAAHCFVQQMFVVEASMAEPFDVEQQKTMPFTVVAVVFGAQPQEIGPCTMFGRPHADVRLSDFPITTNVGVTASGFVTLLM